MSRAKTTPPPFPPNEIAAQWVARSVAAGPMPVEVAAPDDPAETLAALTAQVLAQGQTLLILVANDAELPELSNALDIVLRPLCLVLPSADFAARIAMRATLSLLRSRISRNCEDESGKAWQTQRLHLKEQAARWQQALDWCASNDRSPWPTDIAKLFPARILPVAAYRRLASQTSDLVVFFKCDIGLEAATVPGRHLHVGQRANPGGFGAIALSDEETHLRMELAQLTQDVGELELELATAQAEMSEFTRRYYEQVGRRMTQLDALKAQLAAQHSANQPEDEFAKQMADAMHREAEQSASESQRFQDAERELDAKPFRPSQDIKRQFRQLAQKIHPDRASNEADRAWRTQLMSEANRAYRAADADALKEVAMLWEEGRNRSAAEVKLPAKAKEVLQLQLERMRNRFAEIQSELNRLFGSRLYELFVAVRQAWRDGRDLLREMVTSLDTQIAAARTQLDIVA